MAKKAVASLQSKSKRLTKAIKMVKSPKTGAYSFVESIICFANSKIGSSRVSNDLGIFLISISKPTHKKDFFLII